MSQQYNERDRERLYEGGIVSGSDVTMRDIYVARLRVAHMARRTPLVASPALSDRAGASVHLKLESLQETGSFKIRGAANKLLSLTAREKERGVISFSTGNHARAVAYVAKRLGVEAVICFSKRVPGYRVDAVKALGAEVVVHGESQDEAMEQAFRMQEQRGLTMINAFDDPFIIAGQGTIGLELLEDLPDIDTVLVPVSGGGLVSGIALVLKSADSAIRVIGVSMERAPVVYHSLRAGVPIEMREESTIADALAGGIGLDNQYTFRMVQQYVDDIILVSEEEIAGAMAFALGEHHLVVEGAGAVGMAALFCGRVKHVGHNVAIVVSGSNVDLPLLLDIAQNHIGREANVR